MNLASATQAQVTCPEHGKVTLTEQQYHEQLMNAGARWKCPECGRPADFDQHHWERLHLQARQDFSDKTEV